MASVSIKSYQYPSLAIKEKTCVFWDTEDYFDSIKNLLYKMVSKVDFSEV